MKTYLSWCVEILLNEWGALGCLAVRLLLLDKLYVGLVHRNSSTQIKGESLNQYCSKMCDRLEIDKTHTTTLKVIENMLRIYMSKNQQAWGWVITLPLPEKHTEQQTIRDMGSLFNFFMIWTSNYAFRLVISLAK